MRHLELYSAVIAMDARTSIGTQPVGNRVFVECFKMANIAALAPAHGNVATAAKAVAVAPIGDGTLQI